MVPCNLVNQGQSRMEVKSKKVTSKNFTSSCYLKHAKDFFYAQSVQSECNYIFFLGTDLKHESHIFKCTQGDFSIKIYFFHLN